MPENCLRHCIKSISEVDVDSIEDFPCLWAWCVTECIFCLLMLTLQPCLPPPCPSHNTFVCSTILFSLSLMMLLSSWYPLLSSTTGLWWDVLFLLPPLWSWEMVPFTVDRFRRSVSMVLSGRVNRSFTHACTIKHSLSDIVFKSSLVHLSGPDAWPGSR